MAPLRSNRSTYSRSAARVSPINPGLRSARNWAQAQVRAATYSRRGFWRLAITITAFLFFTMFAALWLGGFLPNAKQLGQDFKRSQLISLGFTVDRVDVVGEGRLSEADVRKALGVDAGDFLFAMDVKNAQQRVEALNWVDRAMVRRLWPDRVVVQIIERRPYALWQHGGDITLVDFQGNEIAEANPADFAGYPLMVGENAAVNMGEIQSMLKLYPLVGSRVDAMIQMPSGRWDIRLNDGNMRVKLPQKNMRNAFERLTQLASSHQILDREISVIDLRLSDRVTFSPARAIPA